ncbi:MAG: NAD(P)-dependent oxidoreductase [Candidatus Latescibacterota bacterium]|nr:NAD(P)-dependent oxidoreductase [Candidatus Latescibacterota bacterium]
MRALITGITGRIGGNVAARLVAEGHAVRGLVWERDQRVEKLESIPGVELVQGTLTEGEDVHGAVDGCDVVFHLGAAFQGGGPFSEHEYLRINVEGTFHVLEAARKHSVRQVLFASSDALYEKYIPGGMREPITEETPSRPRGWYALSKALGEEMCVSYWYSFRLPTTVLRFAMVLGAGEILDFPQFYLSKMKSGNGVLEALWEGDERLVLLRDGQGRPFKKHVADVRDIVSGCLCALGKERSFGQIYQLAGPRPFGWDEAVPRLSALLDIPFVEADPGGVPTRYEFDLSKSQRDLGFQPEFDVVRMIVDGLSYRRGEDVGILPTA